MPCAEAQAIAQAAARPAAPRLGLPGRGAPPGHRPGRTRVLSRGGVGPRPESRPTGPRPPSACPTAADAYRAPHMNQIVRMTEEHTRALLTEPDGDEQKTKKESQSASVGREASVPEGYRYCTRTDSFQLLSDPIRPMVRLAWLEVLVHASRQRLGPCGPYMIHCPREQDWQSDAVWPGSGTIVRRCI